MNTPSIYARFSQWVSRSSGNPSAFMLALILIGSWIMTGPLFGFSDTWQLVMNTITSIVTFLMVFIIQNTQNRQNDALQIKIDELIRATSGAHDSLLDLEDLEEDQLIASRARYVALAERARGLLKRGELDTGTSEAP